MIVLHAVISDGPKPVSRVLKFESHNIYEFGLKTSVTGMTIEHSIIVIINVGRLGVGLPYLTFHVKP